MLHYTGFKSSIQINEYINDIYIHIYDWLLLRLLSLTSTIYYMLYSKHHNMLYPTHYIHVHVIGSREYIYIYIYIHTYTETEIDIAKTHTYICIYIYKYLRICAKVCIHTSSQYIHTYMHAYIHKYIHTYRVAFQFIPPDTTPQNTRWSFKILKLTFSIM